MAMAFTHLPQWLCWWGQKKQASTMATASSSAASSVPSSTIGMGEMVMFPAMREARVPPRRGRRRFQKRSERRREREYDVVVVPSDGGCISGSESDDSDWSIGWFEPHGPDFSSENESENSFAVLVPCYGLPPSEPMPLSPGVGTPRTQLLEAILSNLSNGSSDDSQTYRDQWLSTLHER